jgi:hypothetical protein
MLEKGAVPVNGFTMKQGAPKRKDRSGALSRPFKGRLSRRFTVKVQKFKVENPQRGTSYNLVAFEGSNH